MAAFCRATQYQALAQPMMRPAASSAPSNVGTVTDQPITPNMPSPNHALCGPARCAFSLRATCTAILASKSGSLSLMAQLGEPADEATLHLRDDGSHFALLCIEGPIFPDHCLMKVV